MKINATEKLLTLDEEEESFILLEKPVIPDYSNVTARPLITFYFISDESIWDRFSFCMQRLDDFCAGDVYLGCYALLLRNLYPVLLSDSQAKNVVAYGLSPDSSAVKVFQDFMTFLQMGNALTALPQSPFSFTALTDGVCHALVYNLDACGALQAVCDGMTKVRPGGTVLLYTRHAGLPEELHALCALAHRESFQSCTVYTLTIDDALADYAGQNSSTAFISAQTEALLVRVNDTARLTQAMRNPASCPPDAYPYAIHLLDQTEAILLTLYDYLHDTELPVRANALKEAVMNYYIGIARHYDLQTYLHKLDLAAEAFYAAIETEFQQM